MSCTLEEYIGTKTSSLEETLIVQYELLDILSRPNSPGFDRKYLSVKTHISQSDHVYMCEVSKQDNTCYSSETKPVSLHHVTDHSVYTSPTLSSLASSPDTSDARDHEHTLPTPKSFTWNVDAQPWVPTTPTSDMISSSLLDQGPVRKMQINALYTHMFEDDNVLKSDISHFKVLSWNILTQRYAQSRRFDYVSAKCLDWESRSTRILDELVKHDADMIALQEVDEYAYHEYFVPKLNLYGYEGVYERKKHLSDGCAIFYRRNMFRLYNVDWIHYQEEDLHDLHNVRQPLDDASHQRDRACRFNMHYNLALIVTLYHLYTHQYVRIVNTHLLADPEFSDAKLLQAALLCERLERYNSDIPLIICGDWNSLPDSPVIRYLSRGRIHRRAFGGHNFGRFTRTRTLRHQLDLACAYRACGTFMRATTRTPLFTGEIDRIFYSQSSSLVPVAVLGDLHEEAHHPIWWPNHYLPSDHLPLVAIFADIKPAFPQISVVKTVDGSHMSYNSRVNASLPPVDHQSNTGQHHTTTHHDGQPRSRRRRRRRRASQVQAKTR